MAKIKIKSNEETLCPYCNSTEFTYDETCYEDDMMYFRCSCNKCNRYFEAWYTMHFVGHNVGYCGEHEARVGEEIEYDD